jgi:hypothetical protein
VSAGAGIIRIFRGRLSLAPAPGIENLVLDKLKKSGEMLTFKTEKEKTNKKLKPVCSFFPFY